jgi:hypothetical protein
VQGLTQSYSGLLDRLEQLNLPDAGILVELSRTLEKTLSAHSDLLGAFHGCEAQVRKLTLDLGIVEAKVDEFVHVQQRLAIGMEEFKELLIRSPLLADWAEFRRARPEAVKAVAEADEHFLAGRKDQGIAVLVALLKQRGVGEATLAHHLGLAELSRGRVREARERLQQATKVAAAAGQPTMAAPALAWGRRRPRWPRCLAAAAPGWPGAACRAASGWPSTGW